jgi:nitrogen fixation/metabolism regulation signal transduction histidine kinase
MLNTSFVLDNLKDIGVIILEKSQVKYVNDTAKKILGSNLGKIFGANILMQEGNVYSTLVFYADNQITCTFSTKSYTRREIEIEVISNAEGTCCYIRYLPDNSPVSSHNILKTLDEISLVLFQVLEYVQPEEDFKLLYASTQGYFFLRNF